jgi:hypothetical protein
MAIQVASSNVASGISFVSITDNVLTHAKCRAVYIGTSQSCDFSYDGTNWVTFQGLVAGTVLPIQAVGVRVTSGGGAPVAGDIIFIY